MDKIFYWDIYKSIMTFIEKPISSRQAQSKPTKNACVKYVFKKNVSVVI